MPEPRADMLPGADPIDPVVPGSTPTVPAIPAAPVPPATPAVPVPSPAPVGAATPPENLKAALDEERRMRKEERDARIIAETRVQELEAAGAPSEIVNDEDLTPGERLLKKQLEDQNKQLKQLARDREMDRVITAYPALQDKRAEFETFCDGYPANTGRDKLAKLFLSERGLLETIPSRKGLESATHGPKAPTSTTKFTTEEIDRMMKAEPRRFNKLISTGVIKPEDIPA